MPLEGKEKLEYNFVSYRVKNQKEFWPKFCKEWDGAQQGKRFRSETLSLTELWKLYIGGIPEELTEEEIERGAKLKKLSKREKDAVGEIEPISARRIISREVLIKDEDDLEIGTGEYAYNVRFHDDGYLHFDQWLYARDQARKDLFWLGREVFNMDFVPHVHQVVCDQFVQKDFDGVYREGYTLANFQKAMKRQSRAPKQWVKTAEYEHKTLGDFGKYVNDPIQERIDSNKARTMILLDPRGFFKSSVDGIDTVQWIINCPDIRILIMGGVYKLATQFLTGIKRRFYLPKGQRPSTFHLLFPEYVIRGVDGDSAQPMITPARRHESFDPTLGIISVGSSLSGFHCEIAKLDDVVTDENCNTTETRESLAEKADGAINLVMPWGWIDIIGTRYFPDDYYGVLLAKHKDNPEKFPLKFFQRACWTVLPEFLGVERKGLKYLDQHMVTLTFPEHADWKDLQSKLNQNEKKFRCQQLNQPVWGDAEVPNFPMSLLMGHRVSLMASYDIRNRRAPYIVGAIDTAREAKKSSDYTVVVIGYIYPDDKGVVKLAVVDVDYGKWTQTDIASHIAAMHAKYQPAQWVGEDSGVGDLLKQRILDTARLSYGMWMNIAWLPTDNSPQAKVSRIKGLEILLRAERMDFVEGSWNPEAFEQFEGYKGQKSTKTKKDDIPDAISFLAKFLPSSIPLTPQEQESKAKSDEAAYATKLLKAHHERLFGTNEGNRQMPMPMSEPETPSSPASDIAKRLFGGNGLRG